MTILVLHTCKVKDCPETTHKWQYDRLTLKELLVVQETIGMEPVEFEAGLATGATGVTSAGARALIMLVLLLHRRDGHMVTYDDVDLDVQDLEAIPEHEPPAPATPEAGAEGKGDGSTKPPSRHPDGPEDPTSGAEIREGSAARSPTTPSSSGGATG